MIPETAAQRLNKLTDAACSQEPTLNEEERRGVLTELRRIKRRHSVSILEDDTEYGDPPLPKASVG